MPEWLKRLVESKEDKKARQFEELTQTEEFRAMVRQQASELLKESQSEAEKQRREEELAYKKKVDEAEDTISALTSEMENSHKPYVMIRSLGFTPEKGIEIKLDFNPAFIRYLKKNGIDGKNEDEIVRRWLAYLSHDIIQQSIAEDYVMNGVDEDELPKGSLEEVLNEIQQMQEDDEDESDTRW